MPSRLRLYDLRTSGFAQALGLCSTDIKSVAAEANAAQERLLYCKEANDEGWFGSFAEIAFQASRATPQVTFPREVARLEVIDVCSRPIPLRNQFFEYLQFGNGRMPSLSPWHNWNRFTQGFTRNNVPTFVDPQATLSPFLIKVFCANPADANNINRVLLQGSDPTGAPIYTLDGPNNTLGQYMFLTNPFVLTPIEMTSITGIQKDVTLGAVQFFQSDPMGILPDVLLLTMEPSETVANYRRYYLSHLPCFCCPQGTVNPCNVPPGTLPPPLTITAIAKLELIPVTVDTDYLLIQSKEAILLEAQARRMTKMDTTSSMAKAVAYHQEAVRLLNGQIVHYTGKNTAAVSFRPFGSADLRRVLINMK